MTIVDPSPLRFAGTSFGFLIGIINPMFGQALGRRGGAVSGHDGGVFCVGWGMR